MRDCQHVYVIADLQLGIVNMSVIYCYFTMFALLFFFILNFQFISCIVSIQSLATILSMINNENDNNDDGKIIIILLVV